MNNKIVLVVCYFGPWPKWINFFLKSCHYNTQIDWIIFSDHKVPVNKQSNLFYYPIKLENFVALANKKLELSIRIDNPYKLCDFKPAYGKIFEDYLSSYKYWGYSDIDMVYGKIEEFVHLDSISNFDIISGYRNFISGPFCLFKNSDFMNSLFSRIYDYQMILTDPKHYGIDENYKYSKSKVRNLKKFCKLPSFALNQLKTSYTFPPSLNELRFQFNWFCKKEFVKPNNLEDMTDVIWHLTKKGRINLLNKELVFSDRFFKRNNKTKWEIIWDKGRLYESYSNRSIMAFHFLDLKKHLLGGSQRKTSLPEQFTITSNGFILDGMK